MFVSVFVFVFESVIPIWYSLFLAELADSLEKVRHVRLVTHAGPNVCKKTAFV